MELTREFFSKFSTSRLILASFLVLGLAACESPDPGTDPAQDAPSETSFQLRVIHTSPDAPVVEVLVNGGSLVSGLGYKEGTPFSNQQDAGTYNVQVDASVPGGTATVIGPADLSFEDETSYSVLAVGNVASIEPLIIANPTTDVSAGTVRAQVVHAAPGAPQVDVYVTAPSALLAQSVPLGSFSFKEDLGPVEIPAGDYQIRVTLAGDPDAVVFDSGTVTLPTADLLIAAVENTGPGSAPISLLVADSLTVEDNGLGIFEIFDTQTPTTAFRVIHNSPDAPAVDIIINNDFDNPLLESVPFPIFSDFFEVTPDTYNVKVTAENNAGAIVIDADLNLEAGDRYSVYAMDLLANIQPFVLIDDLRSVVTEAKVRIVHGAPSAGLVDIYVTEVGADINVLEPVFSGVDFLVETGYVGLAEGSYDVTVTVAGTKTAAIGPATISVSAGGVYTAVARDAVGGGGPFNLILLDDFN